MPDPRLCRQVDHVSGVGVGGKQGQDRLPVGNIEPVELEPAICREESEPRLFQSHVIIGIAVIDTDHPLAPLKQGARDVKANEAGRAGEKGGHESGRATRRSSRSSSRACPSVMWHS